MLKEADKNGVTFSPSIYDYVMRAVLAEGSVEDAMVVNDM